MCNTRPNRASVRATLLGAALLLFAACSAAAPAASQPDSVGTPASASAAPSVTPSTASAPASVDSASAAASGSAGSGTAVTAKETEYKIDLGTSSAPAGPITFQITNAGKVVHEFVVMKTDLAADKLPVDSKGAVTEDAAGLTAVDEVEDIAVGASPTLAVDLPAGHYVIICNIAGHYAGGMRADFTTN
jgi:uncharacterized cupredoxin-like copper-binding protein